MISIFVIVAMFAVAYFFLFHVVGISIPQRNKVQTIQPKPKPRLSNPAKELIKMYNSLPADNRPFPDLTAMLVALDIKNDLARVNDHFGVWNGFDYSFSWEYCQYHKFNGACVGVEYQEIKKAIDDVSKAVANQKHQLEMIRVSHDLDNVKALTARLREEVVIIKSVTEELVK